MWFCREFSKAAMLGRSFAPLVFAACLYLPVVHPAVAAEKAAGKISGQLRIPNRPEAPLFEGQQGRQRTEIQFDPSSGMVTMRILAQDPNGYFIPNIRRENFAVYEDGVRQQNATVEIEHSPVSMGILLECGGRYEALNKALGEEISRAAHAFLDEISKEDKIAIWKYGDTIETVSEFSQGHETIQNSLDALGTPPFSELNFYDALLTALNRMQPIHGRKALLVISSGRDTFSKAAFHDALRAAGSSDTPVYVINIGPVLQEHISVMGNSGPYARLDWQQAGNELQQIAKASGGRMYSPHSTIDLAGIYDDLMENLRVRYVITYKSTSNSDAERTVRVDLVDPKTGRPLEIVDAAGKPIRSKLLFESKYMPRSSSTAPGGEVYLP
jgi:VWFA-related protein